MNAHKPTQPQSHLPHAVTALALLLTQGLAIAGVNAEMQIDQGDAQPRQARSDIYLGSNEPRRDPASAQGPTPETDCIGATAETSDARTLNDSK